MPGVADLSVRSVPWPWGDTSDPSELDTVGPTPFDATSPLGSTAPAFGSSPGVTPAPGVTAPDPASESTADPVPPSVRPAAGLPGVSFFGRTGFWPGRGASAWRCASAVSF